MNSKSYWIWHYGDYEIYHFMKLHSRRQEFGADYPAFWPTFTPDVTIKVNPERSDLISTQIIDGVKYILIRTENDNVELNGVNIHIK